MPELDERTIFDTARRIETLDARRQYLVRACCENDVLRARVEALLRAHEEARDFLQRPAVPPATVGTIKEGPGTQIGPYKLIELLGEGGFGKVYLAEQQSPVRRQVALKILKPGMDTSQVVGRFDSERQALALMNHPHIAQILDGGETATGRPFFVMELVHGIPITTYCDEHHLSLRERVSLLVPVCLAVQHAHQKGIIHRDLKPANVLVHAQDGKPMPKVIDFGVAKAIGQQLTDHTLLTGLGGLVGTLEYMSPEQAGFNSRDIDTRTDIYSLGILLYELLSGTTPVTRRRITQVGMSEVLQIIREEEPTKPSTRLLEQTNEIATLSANRGKEPARLIREVHGDLDWIAIKCLEKDRTRRYATANGLARDLERYLNDEPVEAYPPSATYKLRRFARKNRKLILAGATTALVLTVATVLSLWLALWATLAERTASRERVRAEAANDRARRQLYVAHMNLGQVAWEENRLARLVALLDQYEPGGDEPDLRGFEWHYWRRQLDTPLLTLKGHRNRVVSVAYSLDGTRLVSASHDGTVKFWDAETGRETGSLGSLAGQRTIILTVAFSPDGKYLASAGSDQTIKVWNAESGLLIRALTGHTNWVTQVVFSPDGNTLASASHDGTVKIWDWASGRETKTFKKHTSLVIGVAFSPNGRQLASASKDKTVRIWDTSTGQELRTLRGHSGEVIQVAFSPDGNMLASVSLDRTARLWNASSGEEIRSLRGHAERLFSVAFSPDGKLLATASVDQLVKLWDVASGREIQTLKGHTSWVASVAFSPDGARLASASDDRTIKVWDIAAGQQAPMEMTKQNGTSPVLCVTFSPDGKRLAAAGHDSKIKIWDTASGQLSSVLSGHAGIVNAVAFCPAGTRLASAGADRSVRLWDTAAGIEILALNGAAGPVLALAFDPDGKLLATGEDDGTIRIWDAVRGEEKLAFKGHAKAAQCVAFSPNGELLASGSMDQTVKVWDVATGREKLSLQRHGPGNKGISSVAFSPDGSKLASAGADKTVRTWDIETGQQLMTLEGHTDWVSSVAFTPDGKRLASASADKTIKVWDSKSGLETLTLKGTSALVMSVAFSPDGQRLASAGFDGRVRMWDAHPWTTQLRIEQEARGLVSRLFGKNGLKAEVTRQIEADKALTNQVRQEALEMVKPCLEDPRRLNELSWSVVKHAAGAPENYRLALLQAEAACRLTPDEDAYLDTLGVAQYRCDKFEECIQSLGQSDALHIARKVRQPADLSFLAMAHFKVGQYAQAKAVLTELRQLLNQPAWSGNSEAQTFLREAQELIDSNR
jgi:eukaryotic-like serine/threonine-protein kinase